MTHNYRIMYHSYYDERGEARVLKDMAGYTLFDAIDEWKTASRVFLMADKIWLEVQHTDDLSCGEWQTLDMRYDG